MVRASKSANRAQRVRAPKASTRQKRPPPRVDLETKILPSQARSRGTFDAILRVASELLAEKGAGGFSVNAICLRGGLTPPAVYRYFPNKYALLKALAQRLMEAGDDAVLLAMSRNGLPQCEADLIDEVRNTLTDLVTVTASFPGSVQILRAMRDTPAMREVQRASTAKMATRRYERLRAMFPKADRGRLQRGSRVGLESANIAMELIVEGAHEGAGTPDATAINDAATLLARYYWQLGGLDGVQVGEATRSPARR